MTESKFPCSKCGACCRRAGVVPKVFWNGIIDPDEMGVCRHLRADNTCDVYETRPPICRVSTLKPPMMRTEEWHRINLLACDELHLMVYGSPRIPLETS